MPAGEDGARTFQALQLRTLALSPVRRLHGMAMVRAAAWHNGLLRLGVRLPLFVIHDFGLVLCGEGRAEEPGSTGPSGVPALRQKISAYSALLKLVGESELAEGGRASRIRDDLMAVLLSKVLGELYQRWDGRRRWVGAADLSLDPLSYGEAELAAQRGGDAQDEEGLAASFLELVLQHQLYILTAVEQIDLDTVRLLGIFGGGKGFGQALDMADLLAVFSMPEANGIVNFSMRLLPSVLETKRASGVQTFSIDGYASIERQGSIDSIVLSEFAHEDDVFAQKVVDNELYYYGHERQNVEQRSLHYVLVDSSASMRGERDVFARGLALTLCKKLALQGHEVWLRFFDSRLYEALNVSAHAEAAVPQLLCFRSERGRNYGRVFRQLIGELGRLKRQARQIVLYIVTHGQCHIEIELVARLVELAQVYGVFILPSSPLHLDYLSLLHRHQIVDADALASRERSVDRALEIVDDATTASAARTANRGELGEAQESPR